MIIISAKHGQSPTDQNLLHKPAYRPAPSSTAINAAWTAAHPERSDLVVFSTDDDGMLLWLSDRSQQAADFVKKHLLTLRRREEQHLRTQHHRHNRSGLKAVFAGAASARLFGVPVSDPRHPDIVGIAQHGVVYTGGTAKIAEHGGDDPQDRNVPILLVVPGQRFRQPQRRPGRDHSSRPDHPQAAAPGPERPASSHNRAHQSPASTAKVKIKITF